MDFEHHTIAIAFLLVCLSSLVILALIGRYQRTTDAAAEALRVYFDADLTSFSLRPIYPDSHDRELVDHELEFVSVAGPHRIRVNHWHKGRVGIPITTALANMSAWQIIRGAKHLARVAGDDFQLTYSPPQECEVVRGGHTLTLAKRPRVQTGQTAT